jgi:hypothetical protein
VNFSGRIPAPRASCGELFEITYDASRYVPSQRVRLTRDPIVLPDPSRSSPPTKFRVSLMLASRFPAHGFGDALSGRLRMANDLYPFFRGENVFRRGVHATFGMLVGYGGEIAQITQSSKSTQQIIPWWLAGFEGGAGYNSGTLTVRAIGGVGFTTVGPNNGYTNLNSSPARFTAYTETGFSLRPWRYFSWDFSFGVNFSDPVRFIDLDNGQVSTTNRVLPYFSTGGTFYVF